MNYPDATEPSECISCGGQYKYRLCSYEEARDNAYNEHVSQLCADCLHQVESCCECNQPIVPDNDMVICDDCFDQKMAGD